MESGSNNFSKINSIIQKNLRRRKLRVVTPIEVTKWLIGAGIRKKMESRPGSYIRSLCRKGLIRGAKKKGSTWIIAKKQ